MRWALGSIATLLFLVWRYTHGAVGYPSFGWDYAAHISILEEMAHGNWFPQTISSTASTHLVASWLPIYHGIIGSHLMAWSLMKLMALTTPVAMLVVNDLSLALYIFAVYLFWRKARPLSAPMRFLTGASLVLAALPMFAATVRFGFYPQSVSYGFYGLALYFIAEEKPLRASIFLAWAGFCYPDALIWTIPIVTAQFFGLKKVVELKGKTRPALLGILVPVGLLSVQLIRLLIVGGISPIFSPLLALAGFLGFGVRRGWLKLTLWLNQAAFLYLWATVIVVAVSLLMTQDIEYYAAKNLYWAGLLLPILMLQNRVEIGEVKIAAAIMAGLFACGLFISRPQPFKQLLAVRDLILARSIWTNDSLKDLKVHSQNCRWAVAMDGNEVWSLAANYVLGNLTLYDYQIIKPFPQRFKGIRELSAVARDDDGQGLRDLQAAVPEVDCWISRPRESMMRGPF